MTGKLLDFEFDLQNGVRMLRLASEWRTWTRLENGEAPPGLPWVDQSCAATSSAICTVLSAAPLRRLSLEMNIASPRLSGTPSS